MQFNSRIISIISFLRYGFWVLFPLCNIDGKSSAIPTIINQDWKYGLLVLLFGGVPPQFVLFSLLGINLSRIFFRITGGYCLGMAYINTSRKLKSARASADQLAVGSYFICVALVFGLFSGSIASFLGKHLVFNM